MSNRKERRVAVLYAHALFGRGIARLLQADEQLAITCLKAGLPDTTERLKQLKPHAVVVAGREEDAVLRSIILELPATLFISVHFDDNLMDIYRKRQVLTASPETLLEIVQRGLGRKHRAAAESG